MSTFCSRRAAQRGDILIEAIVGVLLTAIIGAGMAYVASRIAATHRDAKVEQMVVERLREQLQRDGTGLCAETGVQVPMPGALPAVSAAVNCPEAVSLSLGIGTASPVAATVEAPREVILRVAARDMGIGQSDAQPALVMGTRQIPELAP